MTTIGPKTDNLGTLLSDLTTEMINNGGWAEADSYVTNDQSTDDWYNNGRALYHAASDTYVALFLDYYRTLYYYTNNQNLSLCMVQSTDWDDTNHHPAGLTTDCGRYPFSGDVGNGAGASFDYRNDHGNNPIGNNSENSERLSAYTKGYSPDISDAATSVDNDDTWTYGLSVGLDYFTIFAVNDSSNTGAAGCMGWEYLDEKFWADGRPPVHAFSSYNDSDNGSGEWVNSTEFHTAFYDDDHPNTEMPYNRSSRTQDPRFGYINSDPDDDSYFFQFAVLEDDNSRQRPIAHPRIVIPNDIANGANDGDTVTSDGRTYRFFVASGGNQSKTLSFGLRWD
ncbi:capsid protein VP3 [Haloarcula hispanica virus PH1]|uniref:Capsid protein VP3 n=1 Tax=Haloarcula hispanica virus PH1 TaxID=1282967 RepID=M4JFA9_9VIRU|nr:capsid protein VP3 [Haloarcula hispanica virus PH1]AGC65553.1 capsid protein VP3 [Haloarcula hispanica virus PH1]